MLFGMSEAFWNGFFIIVALIVKEVIDRRRLIKTTEIVKEVAVKVEEVHRVAVLEPEGLMSHDQAIRAAELIRRGWKPEPRLDHRLTVAPSWIGPDGKRHTFDEATAMEGLHPPQEGDPNEKLT